MSGLIRPKIEPDRALMPFLVPATLMMIRSSCSLSPPPVMQHIKFGQDWPTDFRYIQLRSEQSDPARNQTHLSFYVCPGYQQL